MKKNTLIAFCLIAFVGSVGCGSSGGSSSSTNGVPDSSNKNDAEKSKATEQKIKDGKLNEKYYTLLKDVDFSQGVQHSYVLDEGSKYATKITRYSFQFDDQVPMPANAELNKSSWCNLYGEATDSIKASDMLVKAMGPVSGQNMGYTAINDESSVTIGFSTGLFSQITLFCHNVYTKEDVEREIGQLIKVTDSP